MKTQTLKKRLLALLAVLGLVVGGTGVANANDLYNPDLDNISVGPQVNPSPSGWQIIANETLNGSFSDGADSEPWCNVQQPGGYGVFFKPFQGSTNANPALDNLLNVYFYQDNASSPGTKCTLSGYAAGEANFCAFLPAPPSQTQPEALFIVEFLDNGGNILASNAYDLVANGLPNTGAGSMVKFTTPQFTAPTSTATVRAGAFLLNAYSTTGAQSFFVDAFDLESVAPAGSPIVTTQPAATTVAVGGTTHFTVVTSPLATTYAWTRNGTTVTDGGEFSGSTTATLTITGASTNDVGHYQAQVSNASGLNRSVTVPLALNGLNVFPVVNLYGTIGDTYEVDRAPTVTGPWTAFSTNKLTVQPQYITDFTLPVSTTEFYRQVYLY